MNSVEALFSKTVVLDQEQFQTASKEFAELSGQMRELQMDIETLLAELEKGFDTPAGRRFMASCRKNLIDQLKNQADVIQHVSDNLSTARTEYETVFTEFAALNRTISSI